MSKNMPAWPETANKYALLCELEKLKLLFVSEMLIGLVWTFVSVMSIGPAWTFGCQTNRKGGSERSRKYKRVVGGAWATNVVMELKYGPNIPRTLTIMKLGVPRRLENGIDHPLN